MPCGCPEITRLFTGSGTCVRTNAIILRCLRGMLIIAILIRIAAVADRNGSCSTVINYTAV